MAESRKPPKPPAPRGRLPASGPPVALPPKPSGKSPPKAPVGKAVAKSTAVPVGKAVSSVAPSFGVPAGQSSASAYAHRRHSAPLGVWLGMGGGLIVVAVVVGYLVMNLETGDEPVAKAKNGESKKPVAVVDNSSDEAANDDDPKDGVAKDDAASDVADKSDGADSAKPNNKQPGGEKPRQKKPSADKPSKPPSPKLLQYRTIHEVPKSETPAALETAISKAIALVEAGKFDKLLSDFIDPKEALASQRKGRVRSPHDITGHRDFEAFTLAALKALEHRKPHLVDNGNVAVFSLSDKTLPTFVRRDGTWYLSTGRVVNISIRFRPLSSVSPLSAVDWLIYHLDRLNQGQKAIPAKGAQLDEAQDEFISQLLAMGADVAVNGPGDQIRVAVLLSHRYRGGDKGLEILTKLTNLEVLIFDATNDFTDKGLVHIDSIHSLRHVEFLRIRHQMVPITVHFMNMERLETLRLDTVVNDRDLGHLTKLFQLKHLAIRSKEISDEGLLQLDVLPSLEVLSLDRHEGGVTKEGAERMRQLRPRLWVDW